jgi:hypothetical protein
MGLAEYVKLGAGLQRTTVNLQTTLVRSGSLDLGSAYVLLSMQVTAPCRLRLYDNIQSLNDTAERTRAFNNTNISASTALIGDFTMSAGTYTIDPVVYGVVQDPISRLTYYRIDNAEPSTVPYIEFNRYLLENSAISTLSRRNMPILTASLAANALVSGTIYNSEIPTTYLLVSASVTGSGAPVRLRLYSTSHSLANETEKSRSFASESTATSGLIVDAIMSASEITHFVPKIVGVNLKNMGTNLNSIRNNIETIIGETEIYYLLQNANTSGGSVPISASLHIFSLED